MGGFATTGGALLATLGIGKVFVGLFIGFGAVDLEVTLEDAVPLYDCKGCVDGGFDPVDTSGIVGFVVFATGLLNSVSALRFTTVGAAGRGFGTEAAALGFVLLGALMPAEASIESKY